jgi:hypothetical protein
MFSIQDFCKCKKDMKHSLLYSSFMVLSIALMNSILVGCGGENSNGDTEVRLLTGGATANFHEKFSLGRISSTDPELKVTIMLLEGKERHQVCFKNVSQGNHKLRITQSDGTLNTLRDGECVSDTQDITASILHDGGGDDIPILIWSEDRDAVHDNLSRDSSVPTVGVSVSAGGCQGCLLDMLYAPEADFRNANFDSATIQRSNLSLANFSNATFNNCSF